MENNLHMKNGFTLNSGQPFMSFVFMGEGNQASGILWTVFIFGLLLLLPERTFCETQSGFQKVCKCYSLCSSSRKVMATFGIRMKHQTALLTAIVSPVA